MPEPSPSEGDIIFNRASVALAKSQRLIASWLPPPTAAELANAKSEEDLEKEEQEIFKPMPEVLGLGASIPKEHEIKRQKESTNELLRKQLLGKDYKKFQSTKPSSFEAGPKLRPPTKRPAESDDEGGRSSLGRSKRPKKRPCNELQNGILLEEEEAAGTTTTIEAVDHPNPASSPPTAPRNSYLDEVLLAKKSSKRRKKNRKKKGGGVATNME